jgi:uncharacterized membrane protein
MAAVPPAARPGETAERFMRDSAKSARREMLIRRIFRVGLFLKAAHSVLELVSAAGLALLSTGAIVWLAHIVTRAELVEDPNDVAARFVLSTAEHLSISQKSAAAVYLASHGAVKLFLVVMVLRERPWAYPAFMAALALLIAYQSFQLAHGWSVWLAGLTVLDLVVLVLTWHEYRLQPGR